jgi:single-strand DNA-binding protein
MNKSILMGRICKDPTVKVTGTDNTVANFALAVDRRAKKGEEKTADFIPIVAWGKTAEFVGKYFRQGKQVAVVGRIQTRDYEKEGHKVYVTEVIAEEVFFADSATEKATEKKDEEKFPWDE